jgi:hypothetical protein
MGTTVTDPPAPPDVVTPESGTPSCPANIRETKIAFGFAPQADLGTINTTPQIWSLTKTNAALAVVTPVTEDDSQDIGKGDEFATQLFPTNMDVAIPIEKYVSSEFLAWLFCFTTGKATKTGTAPAAITYDATPSDPVVNCINLPAFTYAEQIRTGANAVVDRAEIGNVINDWTLTMNSGPGRANCVVSVNCVGTGKIQNPSGITFPALTVEHFLNAASATINICGIDYVAAQSFISMEFRWNNNVRLASGFYPGSGTQNGFAIRGRMEYGNREISLSFVARAQKGSQEYANLIALTEGSTQITLTGAVIGAGPTTHSMKITIPRGVFSAVVNGEADGIVTVNCQVRPLKPPTGDIITLEAVTVKDGILGL